MTAFYVARDQVVRAWAAQVLADKDAPAEWVDGARRVLAAVPADAKRVRTEIRR